MNNFEILSARLEKFKNVPVNSPAYIDGEGKNRGKAIRNMKRTMANISEEGFIGGESGVAPAFFELSIKSLDKWGF